VKPQAMMNRAKHQIIQPNGTSRRRRMITASATGMVM
jgi:hypothetical protein